MPGLARGIQFDVEHTLGNRDAVSRSGHVRVLDRMFEVKDDAWCCPEVAFIDEDGPAMQQIPVALQRQIECGIQQRMARAYKCGQGLTLGGDQILLKDNSF